MISPDGRIAFATVTFDATAGDLSEPTVERVVSTAREAASPALQVEFGGQAIESTRTISIGLPSAIGLAAAIVVLPLAFGSVIAMGLPVITALLGLGTAFGVIPLASHVVDMPNYASELAAMIGIGVGIDYALLIVTRFREARRRGDDARPAAVEALRTAARAVLLGGSTVIAVLFVMLAALTVLPALLVGVGRRAGRAAEPGPAGFWNAGRGWYAAARGRRRSQAWRSYS
jgi:RND superfamily putative drug exporter